MKRKLKWNNTLITLIGSPGCGKSTIKDLMQERLSDFFTFQEVKNIDSEHTLIATLRENRFLVAYDKKTRKKVAFRKEKL